MADIDLEILLTAKSEALDVEYKAWMDTSAPEARAKLARHLAALSNNGGGYLIFGVDDNTRNPQGATALAPQLFSEDAIASVVKRYLDPRFQCRVVRVRHEGVEYPVVIVPPHGARPVIAIADGPADEKKQPIGIREGTIYIRAPGPESVAVRRPDDWNSLLDRCLGARADVLARIMRQAIVKPTKPSTVATDLLRAACDATAESFMEQIKDEVVPLVQEKERERVRKMAADFAVLGYALIGEDGELVTLDNLRSLSSRADVGMHEHAYFGWTAFLPLRDPKVAPQIRTGSLLGQDCTYLEGMRPANGRVLTAFDYWRMYQNGICCSAEAYREDIKQDRQQRVLMVGLCLVKLHSVLAHSRLVAQQIQGVAKIVIRMDWRGLSDRFLCWRDDTAVSPAKLRDDRFATSVSLDWSELRDDYFQALRRISLPLFDLFAIAGWLDPGTWFTRDMVERELGAMDERMRLFEQ